MRKPQELVAGDEQSTDPTSAVAPGTGDPVAPPVMATDVDKPTQHSPPSERDSRSGSSISKKPKKSRQSLPAQVNFWATVITAMTAVAALALSVVTWSRLSSRPEMLLTMPKVVGWSANEDGTLVVLRPTFTVSEKTDMTAVVFDFELDLVGPTGQRAGFFWLDNRSIEAAENVSYFISKWVSDPAPFPVTQDSPQDPNLGLGSYNLNKSQITSGAWTATLTVRRVEQAPLVVHFCMNLDDAMVVNLKGPNSTGLWWVRREGAFITTHGVTRDEHCYENAASIP